MLLTRLLGTMALQAQAVIVGWQVYSLTKSPFMLGLPGFAEAIPALICALVAGHIVDIVGAQVFPVFCQPLPLIWGFCFCLPAG